MTMDAWWRPVTASRVAEVPALNSPLPLADSPDSLDLYRIAVEHHLATGGTPVADDELETFFDHVIEEFERGAEPTECAARWARRPLPSPPPV
jgi:hypothetical protein